MKTTKDILLLLKDDSVDISTKFKSVFQTEILSKDIECAFSIYCDRTTLHNFEKEHPMDDRPRKAIEAKEAFMKGEISKEELSKICSASKSAFESTNHPNIGSSIYWSVRFCAHDFFGLDPDHATDYINYSTEMDKQLKKLIELIEVG